MSLNFSLDIKQVTAFLTKAEREIIPKATASALNKTARKTQAIAIKLIAKDLGLKQKDVRHYFKILKASWRNLDASIVAKSKRIPIHKLNAKQTSKGVTYKSRGKRKLIPGAFINSVAVKNVPGAYKRKSKARFPVQFLRSASVPHVMVKNAVKRAMDEAAKLAWETNFSHEVEFYLKRSGYA